MESIRTFEHAGRTVSLYADPDPMSPREWDNLCHMICWHRRYDLGDETTSQCDESDLRERLCGTEVLAILPLYLYDHSGLTINTTGFSCRWDSGQVGWAYITRAQAVKMGCVGDEWTREKLEESIRGEVETYDQYLRGEVYGYEVTGQDGEHLDSCWGFFGLEDCESEGKSAAAASIDPAVEREVSFLQNRPTYAAL